MMEYIPKNIDDMTLNEIKELCQNPDKYGLKWGEYMKLMEGLERAMKLANPTPPATNEDLMNEVRQLRARVELLENRLNRICNAFGED